MRLIIMVNLGSFFSKIYKRMRLITGLYGIIYYYQLYQLGTGGIIDECQTTNEDCGLHDDILQLKIAIK